MSSARLPKNSIMIIGKWIHVESDQCGTRRLASFNYEMDGCVQYCRARPSGVRFEDIINKKKNPQSIYSYTFILI